MNAFDEPGPLLGFIDWFVPETLRDQHGELLRRARLFVGVSFFTAFTTLTFVLANLVSGSGVPRSSLLVAAAAAVLFSSLPLWLRLTGALVQASWLLTFGLLVAVVVAAWNAYGLYSPGLLLLPVATLLGLVLGGRLLGFAAAGAALAADLGFYLLDRNGYGFPAPPLDAANSFLLVTVLGLGVLLVAGIGWFYESLRAYAFARASEALSEAERANAAKDDFLASMSHELRTPLNSVIGFSSVVMKKEELSSSGHNMLGRVQSSGIHLLRLVDQILDVSRLEAGEVELELGEVDVRALVLDTLTELESQKPREAVELLSELPDTCAELTTDGEKLRQIVINLVVNAFKFTHEGSITVRLSCAPSGVPRVLEVADTGIGIPPEKVDQIFERFVQVDSGISRSFDGAGLGLSICKDLCDLLGYGLDVESEVGGGTVFRIDFGPSGLTENS